MVSSQNKRLGVVKHDVQSTEDTEARVINTVVMVFVFQVRKCNCYSLAPNHTGIEKVLLRELPERGLLGILGDLHLQIALTVLIIQRQSDKDLRFSCAAAPLPHSRAAEINIVKFDGSAQQIAAVSLSHCHTDTFYHIPISLTVHTTLGG